MIKWGIMGSGNIANSFVKGLQVIEEADLYAVASKSKGKGEAFAEKYQIKKVYNSYEELAKDPEVDVIYISTINSLHEACIDLAIDNHKSVLCEKPLSLDADTCKRLCKKARNEKVFLMEAFWTKFLPSYQKAKQLVENGKIAEIQNIKSSFCFKADPKTCIRHLTKNLGGGILFDVGIYGLELACDLFGENPIRMIHLTSKGNAEVDTDSSIILNFGSGRNANLHFSFNFDQKQDLYIHGTKGTIKMPSFWNGTKVFHYDDDDKKKSVYEFPFKGNGYEYEALEVIKCLKEKALESSIMSHERSITIACLIDEARKINS